MGTESNTPAQEGELRDKEQERANSGSMAQPAATTIVTTANSKVEVSAQTIARMMGVASSSDLQLLEGRLDLLTSRVSTLLMKVDKVLANLSVLASSGDIGRIETQLASIKSMLKEVTESASASPGKQKEAHKESGEAQSRKLKQGIQSSTDE